MAAKVIFIFCAQALLVQSALSQCLGRAGIYEGLAAPYGLAGRGWGYDGLAFDSALPAIGFGCGVPAIEHTATSGGGLIVTSGSAIPPVGVSVASENAYEGILAAAGEVPFVGTVGVDGVVPTAGAGAVNYGCGNGVTAMVASDVLAPAIGAFSPAAIAPVTAIAGPYGYGAGVAGYECGCGLI